MSEKPEEKKPTQAPAPATKPTALALLLQNNGEPTTEAVLDAVMNGSGMVLSTSEVRRYIQASGRKVKRVADGIITLGVNVAFLRTLARSLNGRGLTIGIGDALILVRQEFGVEIPPQVVKILELASM